jgi:hypothetical protein
MEDIPVGNSPAPFYINHDPLALYLFAICPFVRLFHVVLVLVLNESIASGLACTVNCHVRVPSNVQTEPGTDAH